MTSAPEADKTSVQRTAAERQLRTIGLLVTWGALVSAVVVLVGLVAHDGAVLVTGIVLFVVIGVLVFLRTFLAIRGGAPR